MNWFVFAACTALTSELAIYVFRYWQQEKMDSKRACLRIGMQAVENEKYEELWTGLSGLFGARSLTLSAAPGISFDVICSDGGDVQWLIWFMEHQRSAVENCIYSVMDGAELEDVVTHRREWHSALDLLPARRRNSTEVGDSVAEPEIAVARILNAFTNAGPGEAVMLSTSLQPRGLEASFRFAARLATSAVDKHGKPNQHRADDLMRDALAAYRALQVLDYEEIPRPLISKVANRSTPLTWPGEISPKALTLLTAMPIGEPYASGRVRYARRGRFLPSVSIPKAEKGKTRLLGYFNHRGSESSVAVPLEDRSTHQVIIGPIGSGKTVYQTEMAAADVADGSGITYMDAKSGEGEKSAVDRFANRISLDRIQDTIWYEANTEDPDDKVLGMNILEGKNPERVADNLMPLIEGIFNIDEKDVPRGNPLLYAALVGLVSNEYTFCDLPAILGSAPHEIKFRKEAINNVDNFEIRNRLLEFHDASKEQKQKEAGPIISRTLRLLSNRGLKASLGQTRSAFDFESIIKEKKILLMPLSSAGLGPKGSVLLSAIATSMLWSAVRSISEDENTPHYLYVDEFPDVLNMNSADYDSMFRKARSRNLRINVATQSIFHKNIPSDLREVIFTNVSSKIVFQQKWHQDLPKLARQFGSTVTADNLESLDQYELLTQVPVGGRLSNPVLLMAPNPTAPTGSLAAVKSYAKNKYGRTVADVEEEIFDRQGVPNNQRVAPNKREKQRAEVDGGS